MSRPNYVTVLSGLDNTSLGQAQSKLTDLSIPNEVQGDSILVPLADADTARIQLSMVGIPKDGQLIYSGVQSGFGTTSDSFQIQVLDALQQSLDQTISKMDGIDSADVHIVMPQQQLFIADTQQEAKASVFLKTSLGTQLSAAQVAGIQQLVAHSVNGLSTANVSVTDQNGVDLTTAAQSGALGTSSGVGSELSTEQQIEQQLTAKLNAGLTQLLGPGNSVVNVYPKVSFNEVHTTTHELLTPTPGSNTGYVVDNQTSSDTSGSGNSTSGGVAGQSSTNPGLTTYGQTGNGTGSQDTSKQSSTQYTYGTKDTDQTSDPLSYNGVSVGIILNSANKQINANYINNIKQFVAASMGISPKAQSTISIVSMPFQAQSGNFTTSSGLNTNLIWGGVGAAVLLLVGYVLFRRRKAPAEATVDNPFEVLENPFDHVIPSDDERMKDQLQKLANQKPDEFANLLRTWLTRD